MDHDEHDLDAPPAMAGHGGDLPPADAVPTDPLLALRAELEDVDDLPLDERADVFDRTHSAVVRELRALELG